MQTPRAWFTFFVAFIFMSYKFVYILRNQTQFEARMHKFGVIEKLMRTNEILNAIYIVFCHFE